MAFELEPHSFATRFVAHRAASSLAADPWQRVRVGLGILGFIIALGVVGYRLLGLGLFDALYQTVITVTTVGYGEIGDPEDIDRTYRWFSLFFFNWPCH